MISLFTRKTEGKPKIANKKVNPINSDWSFSSNNNIIGKPQKNYQHSKYKKIRVVALGNILYLIFKILHANINYY